MSQYMMKKSDAKSDNTTENKGSAINNGAPLSVFGLLFIYMNSFKHNNESISCTGPVRRAEGLAPPQLALPVDNHAFKR